MFQSSVMYGEQNSINWMWNIYNPDVCAYLRRALELFSLIQSGDSFLYIYGHSELKSN